MPKSRGTLEEGIVNFHGELHKDVFLEYGNTKIKLAQIDNDPDSGPQLPGEKYVSGSHWLYSRQDAGSTISTFEGRPVDINPTYLTCLLYTSPSPRD